MKYYYRIYKNSKGYVKSVNGGNVEFTSNKLEAIKYGHFYTTESLANKLFGGGYRIEDV